QRHTHPHPTITFPTRRSSDHYAPIGHVLVTDENRKELMPSFLRNKIIILENYPFKYIGSVNKNTEKLTILYNGSMSNARGTKFLDRKSTRLNSSHVKISYAVF